MEGSAVKKEGRERVREGENREGRERENGCVCV
jgi:hypothetical protein